MLCYLRYPGRPLQQGERPPESVLEFVAGQLGRIDVESLGSYAEHHQVRRRHLSEISELLGLVPFTAALYRELATWLLPVATDTGRGPVLVASLLEELRRRRIVVPAIPVGERLCSETRLRAERKTFRTLTHNLSDDDIEGLENLLILRPGAANLSWLAWLRQPVAAVKPRSFLRLVERLRHVRQLQIDPGRSRTSHANRLTQIIQEGGRSTTQHLADFEP